MKFRYVALGFILSMTACQQKENEDITQTSHSRQAGSEMGPVLEQLEKEPQFVWLTSLHKLYPKEYQTIKESMQRLSDEGADLRTAEVSLADAVKPIMAGHRDSMKAASDQDIVSYLRRTTALTEALLNQDPKACTDIFHGNLDPDANLPDSTWTLMSEATAQLLRAAHSAEASPVERADVTLTAEDFQDWRRTMESVGANADTFEIISSPARKATATMAEQCKVRVQMMRGALKLPEPLAAKIMLATLG
jgi:hypothetical protein